MLKDVARRLATRSEGPEDESSPQTETTQVMSWQRVTSSEFRNTFEGPARKSEPFTL